MVDLIEFRGRQYPRFQSEGNAAQFTIPFARKFCVGRGYDIGCAREEWSLPGSIMVDPAIDSSYHAMHLPSTDKMDYIFSSHCLEHLDDWVKVIEYWTDNLRQGGILYLYLPHYSQEYWRPWNNKLHKNILNAEHIRDLMTHLGYINIFYSGVDLNNSFTIVGERS